MVPLWMSCSLTTDCSTSHLKSAWVLRNLADAASICASTLAASQLCARAMGRAHSIATAHIHTIRFISSLSSRCLPARPDLIALHPAAGVLLRLPAVNRNRACYRCDAGLQLRAQFVCVCGIRHLVGAHFEGEFAILAGVHQHAVTAGAWLLRAIVEVDEARRDKEEQQDQRHHDVIVETAALIGPEQIALQCLHLALANPASQ